MSHGYEYEFEQIRKRYKVPARGGQRVKYTGRQDGIAETGTIVGADGQYLFIRIDGDRGEVANFHPTWELEYLT